MLRRIILALLLTSSCFAQDKIPNESVARMELNQKPCSSLSSWMGK